MIIIIIVLMIIIIISILIIIIIIIILDNYFTLSIPDIWTTAANRKRGKY